MGIVIWVLGTIAVMVLLLVGIWGLNRLGKGRSAPADGPSD